MSRAETLIAAIATNTAYIANLDKAAKKKPLTGKQKDSRASAVAKFDAYVQEYTGLTTTTSQPRPAPRPRPGGVFNEPGKDGILGPEATEDPNAPPREQLDRYEAAKEAFLVAEDQVLISQGKPHAREGAGDRGALNRADGIALAKSIGVYDDLIETMPTFFGEDLGPDVSQ